MPNILKLQLLGPIQITRNDEPVKGFESQKAIAMLCYLAYNGFPVARNKLANLFWGSKAEFRGLSNLSRVLNNYKKLLPGYWQITYKTVQFTNTENCLIDTKVFNELLAEGSNGSFAKAIDLFRGDFLEGVSLDNCPDFEVWLVSEQEQWRQKVAAVYNSLISNLTEQGNYAEGIQYASRLLALHPWREETHRRMMLLLALSGQRLAAIQQYRICGRILEEELGVEPSEETKLLYEKILNGETIVESKTRSILPIPLTAARQYSLPAELPPLVAGEIELQLVEQRLKDPACRMLTLIRKENSNRRDILALHVATKLSEAFRDGVFYIPFTVDYETLNQVDRKEANLYPFSSQSTVEEVFQFFRDKEMLIVITNVTRSTQMNEFLEGILKRSPGVKILISSTHSIDSAFEWIFDVQDDVSLENPDAKDQI